LTKFLYLTDVKELKMELILDVYEVKTTFYVSVFTDTNTTYKL